jgi:DNA-binding NtrC family response regulator
MMPERATKESGRTRVLVVDDEKGLRDLLTYGLTRQGYDVLAVSSGNEALEKARSHWFELAICDVNMRGMDGFETLKALAELSPHTKVIMVTGNPTEETLAASRALGAYDFVAKPYELADLGAVLGEAVESQRLKAESAPRLG